MSRRTSFQIRSDILKLCLTPQRKTNIIYKTVLNHEQGSQFIRELLERQMLERREGMFQTTQLGNDFMENLEIIFSLWQILAVSHIPGDIRA